MKLDALLAPCRIVNVTVHDPFWGAPPGNERSMFAILWSDEDVPLGGLVLRGKEMRDAPELTRRAAGQLMRTKATGTTPLRLRGRMHERQADGPGALPGCARN